jgi:hypothetical protein
MIQTKKIYTIICDNCNSDFSQEDEYINQYEDQELMQEIALDEEWIEIDKKHYCPQCYTIDEYDDIQIKLL